MITPAALVASPHFARLRAVVEERTGLRFGDDRSHDFAERLGRRLAELHISDPLVYLTQLARPSEPAALARLLTTGETSFLRHADQVATLGAVILPELAAAAAAATASGKPRRLRIWSAGCASGEEAYTLAILIADGGWTGPGWDVRIIATDLNPEALARTREGVYRDWSFRTVTAEWRNRHFARVADGWSILPRYRGMLDIRPHNLAAAPFIGPGDGPFDLILCRNVLIYFSAATAAAVVAGFRSELRPGGWLGLGPAESSAELCRGFISDAAAGGTLWRRPDPAAAPSRPLLPRGHHSTGVTVSTVRTSPTPPPGAHATGMRPPSTPTSSTPPLPGTPPQTTSARMASAAQALANNAAEERWRRLVDLGDWTAALAVCAERLAVRAGDGLWHLRQGLVSDAAGDAVAAEASLRRALYLDRANPLAHHQLGLLCARANRDGEAARCWRNAREILARLDDHALIAGGDGMTAGDLRRLVALATAPAPTSAPTPAPPAAPATGIAADPTADEVAR